MLDRRTDRGIQLLRIISCLTVFYCHFGQRLYFSSFSSDLFVFSQIGRYGVELFFVISGYLVCCSLSDRKSVSVFYKKRAIRILPLYYFCILYFFLTETLIFRHFPEDVMHLGWIRYIFCLNGIVPSEGYFWSNIGITWTIPVFLFFYLSAPLLYKIAKTFLRSITLLLFSILISIIIQYYGQGWFSAITYIPCFIIGIVVFNARKENREFYAISGFLLFVLATKFCEWSGLITKAIQYSELIIISSVFASILLLSNKNIIQRKNTIKILDYFDEHSYTLYLVHGITFCGILDKFDIDDIGNVYTAISLRLFISIVLTGILTVLVHKYFEKPIQNKLNKWLLK